MAIDEAEQSESGQLGGIDDSSSSEDVPEERSQTAVGRYTWEDFMREHGYESEAASYSGGSSLGLESSVGDFDPAEFLGFSPSETDDRVQQVASKTKALKRVVDERTVDTIGEMDPDAVDGVDREDIENFDEDDFFTTDNGHTTVVNRYDLEKAVPMDKKKHFKEEQRYWVNKPYSFVIIFHSVKENEKKYYAVEPYLNEIEQDLREFLTGKLRTAVKYSQDDVTVQGDEEDRKEVIERETKRLLQRYDLFTKSGGGLMDSLKGLMGNGASAEGGAGQLEGMEARPEPKVLEEDSETLSEYQVEKILYLLKRDFIGYERIDPVKHDINVEDISCDGYNSRVFCYHTDYEQIISNIEHGEEELDNFVVKLAQRSGKGISKRRPQVDATLPDGSRSQLTLGREVSDHGTNYTIRQFKDVPFTPVDLVNWKTFSLEEMAFLWLCIENNKSLIFAGGTASGKTTSLNAISLFIPSNTKIVSIEDTREVELPQRNWVASVTRPSFSEDEQGDVDEFDLLEAALRQRPDYIVMGEVRGEEGRDLFQVMSTGHTSYSTFHADTVGEVLKRFTTDPINVSKTMFTALDLVSIQTQTRVDGHKVRRNKELTEINHYDAENDEINVQTVYQWQAETDEFLKMGDSNTLDDIMFERGWSRQKLERELFKRRIILAYLIKNEISDYVRVAATIQAFINDPDTILALIAKGKLLDSLEDLREMESVDIQVDPEKEALVPRPSPDDERMNEAEQILEKAEDQLLDDYRGMRLTGLGVDDALEGMGGEAETIEATPASAEEFEFGGSVDEEFEVTEEELQDLTTGQYEDEAMADDGPAWIDDDSGFVFDEDDDSSGAIWGGSGGGGGGDETEETEPTTETSTSTAGAESTETTPSPEAGPADEPETDPEEETQIFDAEDEAEDDGGTAESPSRDRDQGGAGEQGDDMESIFGGDSAEDDVNLFDDSDDEMFDEDDGGSIFGGSDDGDQADDDEVGSIFGGSEDDEDGGDE